MPICRAGGSSGLVSAVAAGGRSAPGAPSSALELNRGDESLIHRSDDVLRPVEAIRILTGAPLPAGPHGCCPRTGERFAGPGQRGRQRRKRPLNLEGGWPAPLDPARADGGRPRPAKELLPRCQRLGPADLGRLASVRLAPSSRAPASPRVGLLISGDEWWRPPGPGAPAKLGEQRLPAGFPAARAGVVVAERRVVADDGPGCRQALKASWAAKAADVCCEHRVRRRTPIGSGLLLANSERWTSEVVPCGRSAFRLRPAGRKPVLWFCRQSWRGDHGVQLLWPACAPRGGAGELLPAS